MNHELPENDSITASCDVCGTVIRWISCPTGGWWAHDAHPADHHDAATLVHVESGEDNSGWSFDVRVHRPFTAAGVTYCGRATENDVVDGCGEAWPCATARNEVSA